MGRDVNRERFDRADYERFGARLRECLHALEHVLRRPGFGAGEGTIGAELELVLVDSSGRPLPANQKVLAETLDPRLTYELDRFNIECNLRPVSLRGCPFAALGSELGSAWDEVERAAGVHGGGAVAIGILPTFRPEDFGAAAMSDVARYRALSAAIRRRRRAPFQIRIDGPEPLTTTADDVSIEGANTSFQLHLRVEPRRFTRRSWPPPWPWPWLGTPRPSSAIGSGRRRGSPSSSRRRTTGGPPAEARGRGWPSERSG